MTDLCRTCGAPIGRETFERRVLVTTEGQADLAFFEQLGKSRGVGELQAVRPAGGKNFRARLRSMRGFAPDTSTILIVTDSDDDPVAAFGEIQRQIREVEDYGVPGRPLEVARGHGVPAVAVLTIPWIDRPGNLETLVVEAMGNTEPAIREEVRKLLQATVKTERSVAKDSKAQFSCMVACTCDNDPSCAISAMWGTSKGFQALLDNEVFNMVADYLGTL